MNTLLIVMITTAFGCIVGFGYGAAFTTWRRTWFDEPDPDAPNFLDVAAGPQCPYETVCPSDAHGVLEPCSLAAGHDGPHVHPHTLYEDDGLYEHDACSHTVPAPVSGAPAGPCCLADGHAGPHLSALAIPPTRAVDRP